MVGYLEQGIKVLGSTNCTKCLASLSNMNFSRRILFHRWVRCNVHSLIMLLVWRLLHYSDWKANSDDFPGGLFLEYIRITTHCPISNYPIKHQQPQCEDKLLTATLHGSILCFVWMYKGFYARLRSRQLCLLASSFPCTSLSVRLSAWLLLDEFPLNLLLRICRVSQNLLKIGQKYPGLHVKN